jgi:predicted dehydrogenase
VSSAFGWGVVGTGDYVQNHVAPALSEAPNARLAGVYSRDIERGAEFARAFGFDRSYSSYEEMLSDPEIAIVHVTSPNHLHAPQTMLAAESGKHVLCEKPMALSVADCEHMIQVCVKNGVKLGVGFENRHHPAHVEMRRLVQTGELGAVAHVAVGYSRWLRTHIHGWRADVSLSGGGSLMGLAIHCLDTAQFILGSEVEEVTAFTDERWSGRPVDELVVAIVKFVDGPFCQIMSGINVPRSHNDIVLYGDRLRARSIDTLGMYLQGELEVVGEAGTSRTPYVTTPHGTLVRQIEGFHRSIAEDIEPNASGEDGRRIVILADAILASSRERRAVRISSA